MPRFIHSADIHLDSPLRRLESYDGAPIDEIRGASREALKNLVQLAIEESVDFVIIAGDLYDGDWKDQQTGLFFAAQASRLRAAGIPIYVIRGNHDAASVITKSLPLANNPDGSPVLLSTGGDTVRLEGLGIALHGQSFGAKAETENLAIGYPPPDRGMFNIGILHTSLAGAEGHDRYAPCTPSELIDKGYDYWALGHVHTRGEHQPEGECPIVFPGNLQGRNPRETGPKGCVIVDVDSSTGKTTRRFHRLDVVRWETCEIDGSQYSDADEMLECFSKWAHNYTHSYQDGILVVRVRLVGVTELHHEWLQRHDYFENVFRSSALDVPGPQLWIESLRVRTRPLVSINDEDLDGPLASVMATFDQLAASDSADHSNLEKALETLTHKLPSGLVDLRIPDLIDDARSMLMARLRGQGDGANDHADE